MSRYIDIDKVLMALRLDHKDVIYIDKNDTAKRIEKIPSIDIVRCKECRHCYVDGEQVKFNACELNHNKVQSDEWFCADGEREGE